MKLSFITWDLSFRDKLYTLESVFNLLSHSFDFEIILVGTSKSLSTLSVEARRKLIHIQIEQDIYHPGRLLHIGAQHSTGDYIFFCDGDLIFPDSLLTFLSSLVHSNSIGLFHRFHGSKPNNIESDLDYQYYADTRNQYTHAANTYFLPLKFNNYATCISMPTSLYNASGGFDESPLFSTMSTLFCFDLFSRLIKCSKSAVKVCPSPCFHPWHPTPKVSLSRKDKNKIKLFLSIQRSCISFSTKNSKFRRFTNFLFRPFINSFCQQWSTP